jgi:hypothetical protein
MKNVVHIFLAKATSLNAENFPAGERHALHIYLRQPINSDYDYQSAKLVTMKNGWTDIELIQAGTLSEPIEIKQEILHTCYAHALENGSAILVYSDVEA